MNPIQRLRHWTMRLPNVWGLGQAQIHSSLLIMLGLLSLLIAGVSLTCVGFEELLSLAITLPIVWIVSLAVRVAAQQLVLGECSIEMETTVGPTGNLSTDYEYLPPRRILIYALVGQLATAGLVLLGLLVTAAVLQAGDAGGPTLAGVLDLRGGWGSLAWASQIMWVNIFLCLLHLLPTVPFDTRAALFALFSLRHRRPQEPAVFRRMAILVSHLATFMLGVGLAALGISLSTRHEILGWYAAVAAAVYLFVAGRWESSRADELEEQYAPVWQRHTRHAATAGGPHARVRPAAPTGDAPASRSPGRHDQRPADTVDAMLDVGHPVNLPAADIDEILRKLHREGRDALSASEREALLTASRELKDRRGQTS